ncbi:MAG: hypothetical protein MR290_06915 [Ruminococcus sp.]|nr:hypothetical protein [Ruminococcus sp.]
MNTDTIKLLRECNAGIKMGIDTIESVLERVENQDFCAILKTCKDEHIKLEAETGALLQEFGEESKEPNPLAKGMSYMKTNVKTVLEPGDKTVADLVTDGCHMGVKSLERYLNEYKNAEQRVKSIAEKLIKIEKNLADDIAAYL